MTQLAAPVPAPATITRPVSLFASAFRFGGAGASRFGCSLSPEADGGTGGGGGSPPAANGAPANGNGSGERTVPTRSWAADMIRRHGGPEQALVKLGRERDKLRQRAETAERRGTGVPDGGLALTKEQRAEWEAFVKIGKPAADVVKTLGTADADAKFRADTEAEKLNASVAETAGFDGRKLAGLAKRLGFKTEVRDVTTRGEDGKTVKTPTAFAVPIGDDGKPGDAVELDAYLAEQFADTPDFVDTLRVTRDGAESSTTRRTPAADDKPSGGAWADTGRSATRQPAAKDTKNAAAKVQSRFVLPSKLAGKS